MKRTLFEEKGRKGLRITVSCCHQRFDDILRDLNQRQLRTIAEVVGVVERAESNRPSEDALAIGSVSVLPCRRTRDLIEESMFIGNLKTEESFRARFDGSPPYLFPKYVGNRDKIRY